MDPINEAYKSAISTPALNEKISGRDYDVISFDSRDIDEAIAEFSRVIKSAFKGNVYEPNVDTGDQYVLYISKKKLSKSDIDDIDADSDMSD